MERLRDMTLGALRFNLFLASLSRWAWIYSFMGTEYLDLAIKIKIRFSNIGCTQTNIQWTL